MVDFVIDSTDFFVAVSIQEKQDWLMEEPWTVQTVDRRGAKNTKTMSLLSCYLILETAFVHFEN